VDACHGAGGGLQALLGVLDRFVEAPLCVGVSIRASIAICVSLSSCLCRFRPCSERRRLFATALAVCSRSRDASLFASVTRSCSFSSSPDTRTAATSKPLRAASMSSSARSSAAVAMAVVAENLFV
jgi:hypothetical protein